MMTETLTTPAEVTVTRDIKAPVERVFALWTDRDAVMSWFGMKGTVNHDCRIEPYEGGAWHVEGRSPGGETFRLEGAFLTIEAPNRIVQSWQHVNADGTRGNMTEVEITFTTVEAGTRVEIHHRNIRHTPEMFQQGWTESLDAIEGHLAA